MGACGQDGEQDQVQQAIELAVGARADAYAPYSGFAMGAAVVGTGGRVARGVLVEPAGRARGGRW